MIDLMDFFNLGVTANLEWTQVYFQISRLMYYCNGPKTLFQRIQIPSPWENFQKSSWIKTAILEFLIL